MKRMLAPRAFLTLALSTTTLVTTALATAEDEYTVDATFETAGPVEGDDTPEPKPREIAGDEGAPKEGEDGSGKIVPPLDKPTEWMIQMSLDHDTLGKAASLDVGVIPEFPNHCPPGSEYVVIHTDDEDDRNESYTSGWTGAISCDPTGTTFGFCRVDGRLFPRVPGVSYAVLKLGSDCPEGSSEVHHHFDNEDDHNHNYTRGNHWPNEVHKGNINFIYGDTDLFFCAFPPSRPWPIEREASQIHLPELGFSYGVFGAPTDFWLASGHVHTDDEDDEYGWMLDPFPIDKPSSTHASGGVDVSAYISQTEGQDRPNSELGVVKAKQGPCHNPCPLPGSYYEPNTGFCIVATVPPGTEPFVYQGHLYHTPAWAPSCPIPGSVYDNGFCSIVTPQGTAPFYYDGNLYHTALSGNECPLPGSSFDGKNCLIAPLPPGTTASFVQFPGIHPPVYLLFHTVASAPTCPLPGSSYDNVNCLVARPPPATTPIAFGDRLAHTPTCRP